MDVKCGRLVSSNTFLGAIPSCIGNLTRLAKLCVKIALIAPRGLAFIHKILVHKSGPAGMRPGTR